MRSISALLCTLVICGTASPQPAREKAKSHIVTKNQDGQVQMDLTIKATRRK